MCLCDCVYGGVGWWTQAITFIREKRRRFTCHALFNLLHSFPSFLPFFLTTIYNIQTFTITQPTLPFFFALFRPFSLRNFILCKFVQMWMMRDESSWVFIQTDRQTNAALKCNIIMHMHYNIVDMHTFCVMYVGIFLI